MKELSIEEKAKRYDDRLEKAKKWYDVNTNEGYSGIFEDIFPELKESEDERIRKEIIVHIKWCEDNGYCAKEEMTRWINWLEKQGEQKPVNDTDEDIVEAVTDTSILDLVEPKFHEDDWVVWQDKCYKVNYNGCGYELIDQDGLSTSLEYGTVEESAHLWDITKDAKDGDVLSNGKMIVIFKHFEEPSYRQHIVAYIGLDTNGDIQITDDTWNLGIDKTKPATKEQRDLLFQKMKEAGYTFNFDKKELKKIITPIFNFGDTIIKKHNSDINKFGQFTITDISGGKYWYNDRIICDISEQYEWELVEQKPISFDTSTPVSYDDIPFGEKDYELHEATYFIPEGFHAEIEGDKVIIKRGEQKLAWSEDDETGWTNTMIMINECAVNHYTKDSIKLVNDWLESLKERVQPNQWKPSKEQMETLEYYMVYLTDCKQKEILFGLYDQLAKL